MGENSKIENIYWKISWRLQRLGFRNITKPILYIGVDGKVKRRRVGTTNFHRQILGRFSFFLYSHLSG
jgi:hypothetical protein